MKQPDSRAESGLGETWYRIPDAREIRVNRINLTRFTLHEPLWDT